MPADQPSSNSLRFLRWLKRQKQAPCAVSRLRRLPVAVWEVCRLVPLLNRLEIPVSVDGHRLRIRLFLYDDLLTVSDDYERCLAGVLPPPGGVAVDAGAFIGRHTLAYAHAVGPQGRVVAIEPLPANFRLLAHNVQRNGYHQVSCVECALGREDGPAVLSYDWETSTASLVRDLPRRVSVPQRTLTHVLGDLGIARLDLLKLDVEGAEGDVLQGSLPVLQANPQATLAIEVHGRPRPAGTCPVENWLLAHGYLVQRLQEGQRLFYVAKQQAAGG